MTKLVGDISSMNNVSSYSFVLLSDSMTSFLLCYSPTLSMSFGIQMIVLFSGANE